MYFWKRHSETHNGNSYNIDKVVKRRKEISIVSIKYQDKFES